MKLSIYAYQIFSLLLLFTICLAQASTAQAQEVTPRSYQAIAVDSAIAIDGTLNESTWQEGEWQTGFVLLDSGDIPAPRQTSIKIRHDDKAIYLAARLDRIPDHPLKADATERDQAVYDDDCIEFMLATRGRGEYAHFIVNSAGVLFDEWRHQGGAARSIEWDSAAQVAARVYDDHWTVELAVPLSDLGISKESKGDWYFSVCRSEHVIRDDGAGIPYVRSSFSPGFAGFNQPRYFATLTLLSSKIDNYLWRIKPPVNDNIVLENDAYVYRADLSLLNQTPRYQFITVDAELLRQGLTVGSGSFDLGIDSNDTISIPLSIPLERPGDAILRITVRDRSSQTQRASRDFPLLLNYNPLSIQITQPTYRRTIYPTQNLKQIEGLVHVNLTQEEMSQSSLEVSLVNKSGTLASQVIDQVDDSVQFFLPATAMDVGEYEIVANVRNRQSQITKEARKSIRKVGPPPAGRLEVRLNEHRITLVNGEPFLPYGWFSIPEAKYGEHVADGCNILVDYNVGGMNPAAQKAFLDKALAAGIRVLLYPYPSTKLVYSDAGKLPLTNDEAELIRQHVRRLSKHPAVFGWYMADEPTSIPILPSRLQAVYRIIQEEDPYGICVLLHDRVDAVAQYPNASDVQMPDPYPLFLRNGYSPRGIEYTSRFFDAIRKIPGKSQATWITPQGFNYGDFGLHGNRAPTFDEIRNQQYQAVIGGAKGFVWYSRWYIQSYPNLITAVSFHTQEAHILKDAILSPSHASGVSVASPDDHMVLTSLRNVGEHQYIFVVNNATKPVDATLQLPEGSPTRWYVVSEGRVVDTPDGILNDHFDHYGVHIYTTDESVATRLDVNDPKRLIRDRQRKLVQSANYAHRDLGGTPTVSNGARRFSERHLNDGITAEDYGMEWPQLHEGWKSEVPLQLPAWAQISFDVPRTISRIVVTSNSIGQAQIQVRRGEQWQSIADVERQNERTLTAEFPAVTCTEFRVFITNSHQQYVNIEEIEAYEH